ncbi:hypothetical protein CRYUN_Cryun17cG0025500 [Craigia yunnanensis]
MEEEKDAFYVVKKGDVIGIYKSLRDLLAEAGISVYDPSLRVYKGYGLSKQAEQPTSFRGNSSNRDPSPKRSQQILGKELVGSTSLFTDPRINHMNFANQVETQMMSSNCQSCIVEFDGASRGNPGPAGAGAVFRAEDGRVVQGRWKIKSQNLVELNKEAKELKDKFVSFQINHVYRESNSEADALANQAVNLMNGQVQEDWIME